MIKEIENWLLEPVYWTGVELYQKYGSSSMFKRMFAESADSSNKKKLAKLLGEILEAAKELEASMPVIPDSPEVQQLRKQANSLMDERSALKERARILVAEGKRDGAELQRIAESLAFGIRGQLDSIFGRIQYAQVNGSLPETDAAASLSIAEMIKRRNNIRTYLSRSKNTEKVEKWKAEAFQLDLKIKELEQ